MGAAWTSGSSGPSTSPLYSGLRYRVRSGSPSVEEVVKVGQVLVVEGLVEVDGGAGVAGGEAPDHPPWRPGQRVARESHHGLADARDGDEAVRHLRHPHLRPAEAEGVDEHELARERRPLERDLERHPSP